MTKVQQDMARELLNAGARPATIRMVMTKDELLRLRLCHLHLSGRAMAVGRRGARGDGSGDGGLGEHSVRLHVHLCKGGERSSLARTRKVHLLIPLNRTDEWWWWCTLDVAISCTCR